MQMQTEELERHDHGTVLVELCFTCAGIWFDPMVSVELAPHAVIQLFKEIHEHQDVARQPVASHLSCPRCNSALALSFDLAKSGRFSYFRCPRGDGRFTPFFQFLREKQFVRSLTPAEIQQVRSQVQQINCSQCGAPIDLALATECQYCHAPVSLLDPNAVDKAMRMWTDAENGRRAGPSPATVADAMLQVQHERAPYPAAGVNFNLDVLTGLGSRAGGAGSGLDLVGIGIQALGLLLGRV
jgi:hypothetical protein